MLLVALSFSAMAQSTSTRQVANGVTDASVMNFKTVAVADAVGTDTTLMRPNAAVSTYNVTITDSLNLRLYNLAGCYKGDVMTLYITKATGSGAVSLIGNWVVSTGTSRIALTASKKNVMRFIFDGVSWIEISRNLNY